MKKTLAVSKKDIVAKWHLIDAKDKVLGRVASDVAKLLMGKDKPTFSKHINVGDKVVIINASSIAVTGKKLLNKMYQWHSFYPDGFKEETFASRIERKPEQILRDAIYGMLPVNKMRERRIVNLYIYKDGTHPHKAQLG